jgi:Rrf2 family iron-sulfur cluster assembly transcriptional regulator
MELSAKVEYGVRAMLDLGLHGGRSTFEEIATRQSIPPGFMPQIMRDLSKAGLVVTARGFGGGVELAGDAAAITVRAIVEALQGPLAIFRCLHAPDRCPGHDNCVVQEMWSEARQEMAGVLERTTLGKLVTRARRQPQALPLAARGER